MHFEFKGRLLHLRRQPYPTQQAPYDARSIGVKLRRSGASGFLLTVPVLSLNSNDVPNFEISIVSFILSGKSTNERSRVFQQAFERGGRSKRFRI
jgi:hypothetical protein